MSMLRGGRKSEFDEEDGNGDDNSGRANDHYRGNGETATPHTSTFEECGLSFCHRYFIDNRTHLNLPVFFVHFLGRERKSGEESSVR